MQIKNFDYERQKFNQKEKLSINQSNYTSLECLRVQLSYKQQEHYREKFIINLRHWTKDIKIGFINGFSVSQSGNPGATSFN